MSLTDILNNKTVRKTVLPLALVGTLFLNCGKDKISNPDQVPEPKLAEETKILSSQDLEKISAYDNGLFVFSDSAYVADNFQIGDILVSGISDYAPYGFLREIKSISPDGTRLETSPASLEKAIESGDIHIEGKLMPALNSQYKNNLKSQTGFDWSISIDNEVLYDLDGNYSTTNDQITADGHLQFNYDYELKARIRKLRIRESGLEYFLFNNTISEGANLKINAQISEEIDEEKTVFTIPLAPITYFLPTIPQFPIVFTPEAEINIGVKGTISLGGNFEVTQNAELQAGIKYENSEWNLINEFENNFNFEHDITGNASIKGYIGPEIVFYLYGGNYFGFGGGISAEVNATSRIDANTSRIPWFRLYGGLEAKVGAELEMFSKTVADYEATVLETERLIFDSGDEVPGPIGEIAFNSFRDGSDEICIMNADGSNQRNLTNYPSADRNPAWSPDGRYIAFASFRDASHGSENHEIYIMNSDGSNQIRLTNNSSYDNYPAWSPDGRYIAFISRRDGNHEIYIMNADGSNQRNLTNDLGLDFNPTWSPDGRYIAFRSFRDHRGGIYIMNADGSNQRNLDNDEHSGNANPAWSPDGRYIAFSSRRDGNREIYIMNADGSNQRNLTNSPDSRDYYPDWSPDGRYITFASFKDGDGMEIYIMNSDGSNQTRLTNDLTRNTTPAWRPTQ